MKQKLVTPSVKEKPRFLITLVFLLGDGLLSLTKAIFRKNMKVKTKKKYIFVVDEVRVLCIITKEKDTSSKNL